MTVRTCSLPALVRSEAKNPNGAAHVLPTPHSFSPRHTMTKPSLIVKTESNVRREVRKKPDPPCVSCKGSRKVDCYDCEGEGRTNCINSAMLPKGEWPRWCKSCGGSGLKYCARCFGTGEHRRNTGFDFMSGDGSQDQKYSKSEREHSVADVFFMYPELLNPGSLNSEDDEDGEEEGEGEGEGEEEEE